MIDWAKLHHQKTFSAVTPLLAPLSFLYGALVRLRVKAYPSTKRRSLPGFVVSIGNLTAGGTGKTPAAVMIAEWAVSQGYRAAILSRGYGGKHDRGVIEVSDGTQVLASAVESGDEPYLMAKRLAGVPVIISRERYLAGLLAHTKHGTNFFILDDGFQHISLGRNLDLVLMDWRYPFGNRHLLPWGPLREPLAHLRRADAFILTRAERDHGRSGMKTEEHLKKIFPEKPVFLSQHIPEKIIFPHENKVYNSNFLKGKRVIAFAGIARPNVFRETLQELGAEVLSLRAFRDHHVFTAGEINQLSEEKKRLHSDCLVTTEKDWVRIEGVTPPILDLAYLTIRFQMASSESFFKMIRERRGELPWVLS